ncbi:MAG: hypothetical protein ACLR8P_16300 [Clostridium fessum]
MTKTTKVAVDENEQGYLGIQPQNIDSQMAQAYGMPEGIYVYKIVAGGAASIGRICGSAILSPSLTARR